MPDATSGSTSSSTSGATSDAPTTSPSSSSPGNSGASGDGAAGSSPTSVTSEGTAPLAQSDEEDGDDSAEGSPLVASSKAISNGIYSLGVGVGKLAWDFVAVPYDLAFGTEHSYYGSATAAALRQGVPSDEIINDVGANVVTFGLKGLKDSAQNYYETGDPTQFQEYSGAFLVGALSGLALEGEAAATKPPIATRLKDPYVDGAIESFVRVKPKPPIEPAPAAPSQEPVVAPAEGAGIAPKAVPSIKVNTPANAASQTIGELLPGLADDAMIHLSPEAAESFVQGVNPGSYFVRYGDVKNLTVGRFKGEVVLPLAPAFETEAATFVIKKQPSPGMFGPAPEGAGEYLNNGLLVPDEIVTIPPIPPKTRF